MLWCTALLQSQESAGAAMTDLKSALGQTAPEVKLLTLAQASQVDDQSSRFKSSDGFFAALGRLAFSAELTDAYAEGIRAGGAVVAVLLQPQALSEAERILRKHGAEDIRQSPMD